jgi:hypothetical protein
MTLPEWTTGVHHDGSARYVSEPLPRLGQIVQLKLRIPSGAPIVRVFVRTAPDGENHFASMHRTTDDGVIQCWEGDLHISMPKNHYRFKMITETGEAYHFNAAGISRVDRRRRSRQPPDCLPSASLIPFPPRFAAPCSLFRRLSSRHIGASPGSACHRCQ